MIRGCPIIIPGSSRIVPMPRSFFILLVLLALSSACASPNRAAPLVDRLSSIPGDADKQTPETDLHPPSAGPGWSQPVPLQGPINTAGAEDSPFLPADGRELYFFFTPDLRVPVERQLLDQVTGIYVSQWTGSGWGEPERVRLTKGNELSMDGCEFVLGDEMWFCSARAGNHNEIDWYIAKRVDGGWSDWKNAGLPINGGFQVGELHLTLDGQEMYFGSARPGGYGGLDLWVSTRTSDGWGQPANLGPQVNTAFNDGWPYVSPDGTELWYSSHYSIYRCLRQPDGSWIDCKQIISAISGEPTLSPDGKTLYFVHHYLDSNQQIIEADIYVSQRLEP